MAGVHRNSLHYQLLYHVHFCAISIIVLCVTLPLNAETLKTVTGFQNSEDNIQSLLRKASIISPKQTEIGSNTDRQMCSANVWRNKYIADKNLDNFKNAEIKSTIKLLGDGEVMTFNPGDLAPPFSLYTLSGKKLIYPGATFSNVSTIFHLFDPDSAFLSCMWMSDEALAPLFNETGFGNTQIIFIAKLAGLNDLHGAKWMQQRLKEAFRSKFPNSRVNLDRFYISVEPASELGSWISALFNQWQCVDHLCGYDQVVLQSQGQAFPTVMKRLDARYDWLPSPSSVFGNKTIKLIYSLDGCALVTDMKGSVALVIEFSNCTYIDQITHMQASGAVGVIVMAAKGQPIRDLHCLGAECTAGLHIPASSILYNQDFLDRPAMMSVTYQNTPSENFFAALTSQGRLAEVGWFLYPSMNFLMWQAQWFTYEENLQTRLNTADVSVQVFKEQTMQGSDGVQANVTFSDLQDLHLFQQMELDLSLSCPGTRDTSCAHWDHTVNLYVCCDKLSPLCGMELGRWITPFRRRIGRWLSDVSPLMPLITNKTCTFTLKTAAWAMPWVPSLYIHFKKGQSAENIHPFHAVPLYQPGATFDKNYNSHFPPYKFVIPQDVVQVQIFAVITGHGSDENGCGEFCVTSHHFKVNEVTNNITFSVAGSPLGCADQVLTGVEPNEHGTWLYGRNGWCDGRNVFPWVINVTQQVLPPGQENTLTYFGWFKGTDPDPKHNPGEIILYSYLIYYKKGPF